MRAHDGDVLRCIQAHHIKLLDNDRVFVLGVWNDGECVGRLTLSLDVLATHLENHGGTAAVLYGRVATELDDVRVRKHCCDVVSVLLHILDQLHSVVELRIVRSLLLSVESKNGTRSTMKKMGKYLPKILKSRYDEINAIECYLTYTTSEPTTVPAS
jgi:hypothetical protein